MKSVCLTNIQESACLRSLLLPALVSLATPEQHQRQIKDRYASRQEV